MPERFNSASEVSQAIKAAQEGDFSVLLQDDSQMWWAFVRERLDLGADELMLRIDLEDVALGPWCIWLVVSVQEQGGSVALEAIFVPDYENDHEAALAMPEGQEQVPYFVLSHTSVRQIPTDS